MVVEANKPASDDALALEFVQFSVESGVLRFGEFKTKAGRMSPYFFNAGLFNSGRDLAKLGRFYAAALVDAGISYDVLFGPAYKGIPIASATAVQLAEVHDQDVPWCFNRKEAKDHGEGGLIVGAPLAGRVLIVDDVITAGTAVRESLALIRAAGASVAGVVVAFDRQERGQGALSATQELARDEGVPTLAIVGLADLLEYAGDRPGLAAQRAALADYQARHAPG